MSLFFSEDAEKGFEALKQDLKTLKPGKEVILVKPLFLSSQAEQGFNSLRTDLGKLRQKNLEVVPERHIRMLDKAQELSYVIITIIVAVAVIVAVWTILTSSGMDAVTKMVSWVMDILKLVGV